MNVVSSKDNLYRPTKIMPMLNAARSGSLCNLSIPQTIRPNMGIFKDSGWTGSFDNISLFGNRNKHKATSHAPDCFTLVLKLQDDGEVIEKIPARKKEITLSKAVSGVLQKYLVSAHQVEFFDLGDPNSRLSPNIDVGQLRGRIVSCKHKEHSGVGGIGSRATRRSEKRNSASGDRTDKLNEQLAQWSSSGLPLAPAHILTEMIDLPPEYMELEPCWDKIVKDHEKMPIRRQKQQAAIWELMQTEVNFIKQIKSIIEVHMAVFYELQSKFFPDIEVYKVFGNLDEVYNANCYFWREFMIQPLMQARLTGASLQPALLQAGFRQVSELLKPHTQFCIQMSNCRRFIQKQEKENHNFALFLQWSSGLSSSNREGLCDLLAKPFQRLTKYKPVLESIRKYSIDPEEINILDEMVMSVSIFVKEVNDEMIRCDQRERLEHLDDQIEAYEVLEPPGEDYHKLVEEFSGFRLTFPMRDDPRQIRQLLHKGTLRLKDGQSKWVEVYCMLFTDLFLITKHSKKNSEKLKIYKSPIRLDKIVCRRMTEGGCFAVVVLNDFNCICSLYAMSTEVRKTEEWMMKIRHAKRFYCHQNRIGDITISFTNEDDYNHTPPIQSAGMSSPRMARTWSVQAPPLSPRVFDHRHRASTFTGSATQDEERLSDSGPPSPSRLTVPSDNEMGATSSGSRGDTSPENKFQFYSLPAIKSPMEFARKKLSSPIMRRKAAREEAQHRTTTPPIAISVNSVSDDESEASSSPPTADKPFSSSGTVSPRSRSRTRRSETESTGAPDLTSKKSLKRFRWNFNSTSTDSPSSLRSSPSRKNSGLLQRPLSVESSLPSCSTSDVDNEVSGIFARPAPPASPASPIDGLLYASHTKSNDTVNGADTVSSSLSQNGPSPVNATPPPSSTEHRKLYEKKSVTPCLSAGLGFLRPQSIASVNSRNSRSMNDLTRLRPQTTLEEAEEDLPERKTPIEPRRDFISSAMGIPIPVEEVGNMLIFQRLDPSSPQLVSCETEKG